MEFRKLNFNRFIKTHYLKYIPAAMKNSPAFCSNLLSGTILQPFYCCLQHFLKCTIFCLIFVFHKFSFVNIYSICVDFSFNLHYSCNYIIYNHQSIKKCTVYQHIKKNC